MTKSEKILTAALYRCARALIRETKTDGEVMTRRDYCKVIIAMNACLASVRREYASLTEEWNAALGYYKAMSGKDLFELEGLYHDHQGSDRQTDGL